MTIDNDKLAQTLARAPREGIPIETPAKAPRIALLDIERLPGLTTIFDQRVRGGFIPVRQWRRLPSFLCYASKWYGKATVDFHASWDDPDAMLEASWRLYDEADLVVGYNSKRFDNKHLRGAWLVAGLPAPRPWRNVDLFTVAAQFGFESRSLAHLCKMLGLPGKSGHYDADEAEACMNGDTKAQRSMTRYNKGDVRILEPVYDRLRPWMSNHPHVGNGSDCEKCGGVLTDAGFYSSGTYKWPQFRCMRCGGVSRAAVGGVRSSIVRGVSDQ